MTNTKKYIAVVNFSDYTDVEFLKAESALDAMKVAIKEILCLGDKFLISEYESDYEDSIDNICSNMESATKALNNSSTISKIIDVETEETIYEF